MPYTAILSSDYSRQSFIDNVLKPIFQNRVLAFILYDNDIIEQYELTESEKEVASAVIKYGEMQTSDNKTIELFDVVLRDNVRIERNKIKVGSLVKNKIMTTHALFANFSYETPNAKEWRFSFIAYDSFFEEGDIVTQETNPKRYTYLLGSGNSCRTASNRFDSLTSNSEITLPLVKEAFSVENVSKDFFNEYRKHYGDFVQFLTGKRTERVQGKWTEVKKGNPNPLLASTFGGDEKKARDFCKKTLGRIVFLYFLQKKGWLGASSKKYTDGDPNFLQNFFKQTEKSNSFYPNHLSTLFFDTLNSERANDDFTMPNGTVVKIPFLNGGLFDVEKEEYRFITFPPELFENLFEFFNRYNFTVYEDSSEDHTVAVDPEMLGHIFENLLEDNKDKGAFYTPRPIVEYMCQESLVQYLLTQSEKEGLIKSEDEKATLQKSLELFVKNKDIEDLKDHDTFLATALRNVKICDPAIGSGAFPMGILHEVFTAINVLHTVSPDVVNTIWDIDDHTEWQPAQIKEHIIQNSIYGVDIEKGAVDIARLRFWLSLVVDEDIPRALPNLDYKIVVGDSLISKFEDEIIEIDWHLLNNAALKQSRPDLIQKIRHLAEVINVNQRKYFSADSNKKSKISDIIKCNKAELIAVLFEVERQKLKEKGIQPDFSGNKKEAKEIAKRKIQYESLNTTINKLHKIKDNPKLPFNHFDWKLDFPEILNPVLYGIDDSPEVVTINKQVDALNKEIDAINKHFELSNSNLKILRLQLTVANKQVDITTKQLQSIEKILEELNGTILNIEKNILSEPRELNYKINSINNNITKLNQQIDVTNSKLKNVGNVGFDIVIGNPPYGVSIKGEYRIQLVSLIGKVPDYEIYYFFTNFVKPIIKDKGILSYIIPNTFLFNTYAEEYRKQLLETWNIVEILDCSKFDLFETATVRNAIVLYQNTQGVNVGFRNTFNANSFLELSKNKRQVILIDEILSLNQNWGLAFLLSNEKVSLVTKIKSKKKTALQYFPEISQGLIAYDKYQGQDEETIKNRIFHYKSFDYNYLKKWLWGADVTRYNVKWNEAEYINYCDEIANPRDPKFFNGKRLLIREITNPSIFAAITKEELYNDPAILIVKDSEHYSLETFLAILNSKIGTFFHFHHSPKATKGAFPKILVQDIKYFPLPFVKSSIHNSFKNVINQILENTQSNKDTTALEQEIDTMVFKLYELSYDEVLVVEPEYWLSKEEYEGFEL